ncbi:MAG: ABC transporter substrate-binding protein [Actinomycetota bacterium]|nr:ABC transporter substrate-binding protein [Actinomycetota bacterium]
MIDRRTFLARTAALAGGLALGGLAACGTDDEEATEPEREGRVDRPTLRLPAENVGFPSPFAYMRGPGLIRASLIYDTLVWKDKSGEVLPWLAESYERSDDALSYTFQLRPGVSWHDGRALTADDVAFTFEYFRTQRISPQVIAQPLPEIAEVRATGERTVEFRLATPLAPFLGFGGVGSILIVPRHVWSSIPDAAAATDAAVLVGSGPYRLESYNRGEGSYLFTANDDYFLGRPLLQRLEYRPVGQPLAGVTTGELNAASVSGVTSSVLAPFRDNPALEVLEAPPGNFGSGLFWNLAKGGALADVRFRRACAHAIDREDMVQRLHGGNAEVGNPGWIPEGNPFHVDVEQYRFDRERANQLLDEAGYSRPSPDAVRQGRDGRPLRFSLLVTSPPAPTTQLVVNALKEVGVELTPEALDTPAFNQRVIAGGSEMSIIGFGGMNTDHAPDYLRQVYSSKTRTTQHAQGYANPEVDRLVQEQLTTVDESRRKEIVGDAQRLIADDLPILPLVYPRGFTVFTKNAFDAWYYTEGGVASTVPTPENKHVFVTGRETGLEVRPTK